jgi:hypothetical protein
MVGALDRFTIHTNAGVHILAERTPRGVLISVDYSTAELSLRESWELSEALDRLSTSPSDDETNDVDPLTRSLAPETSDRWASVQPAMRSYPSSARRQGPRCRHRRLIRLGLQAPNSQAHPLRESLQQVCGDGTLSYRLPQRDWERRHHSLGSGRGQGESYQRQCAED